MRSGVAVGPVPPSAISPTGVCSMWPLESVACVGEGKVAIKRVKDSCEDVCDGTKWVGGQTVETASEMRERGTVVGQVMIICVSRLVGGWGGGGEEGLFVWGDFWPYLTIVSEESRRTKPSWNSDREIVGTGVRRDVGCGEGSDGSENTRESEVRGREDGLGIDSLSHRLESLL